MLVSPSIISSDLAHLESEIKKCEKAGATSFHLDVMDGHFVPNLTMGPDLVKAIRKSTELELEAHLMVDRPDNYYRKFVDAGSDIIQIHYESPINTMALIRKLESEGVDYGMVINPDTAFESVKPFMENSKMLLVMSVYPGFSGQKFIESVLPKVKEAREYIDENKLKTKIEIDGGINDETGKMAVEAGVDILVSGSYIFSKDIEEKIKILKSL